jgi:hypothetical protein
MRTAANKRRRTISERNKESNQSMTTAMNSLKMTQDEEEIDSELEKWDEPKEMIIAKRKAIERLEKRTS